MSVTSRCARWLGVSTAAYCFAFPVNAVSMGSSVGSAPCSTPTGGMPPPCWAKPLWVCVWSPGGGGALIYEDHCDVGDTGCL